MSNIGQEVASLQYDDMGKSSLYIRDTEYERLREEDFEAEARTNELDPDYEG